MQQAHIRTQKIQIPNYKRAYNPSIISYKNGYLLTFRYATSFPQECKESRSEASFIGICRLDASFNVLATSVQLLPIISHRKSYSVTAEDARIFSCKNRLFVIFNDKHEIPFLNGCKMYLAELIDLGGEFIAKELAVALQLDNLSQTEKNWSPFIFQDECYVIYSDNPRVILKVDVDSGICQRVHFSDQVLPWNYGQVRGGSQGVQIEDQFLTFFHSNTLSDRGKRRYHMGAYTFNASYPFAITKATKQEIEVQDCEKISEDGKFVVFPGGLVVDSNCIHVVWGKDDKRIYISSYDRKKFLSSLDNL